MATQKCDLCSSDIETGFMDKIMGTQVVVKKGDSKKTYYVCSACQKEKGASLRDSF